MNRPPYKCLYCLSKDNTFLRQEHPIPESLGNDDTILPPGYVCDPCNQYFGSKLEQTVLFKAPFGIERVAQAIKSKKGKYPLIENGPLGLKSTGYWDHFIFCSEPPHSSLLRLPDGQIALDPEWASPNEIARFLLKMGLGLLAIEDDNVPYDPAFNAARCCARFGQDAENWDFALGLYPDRKELTTFIRYDQIGPLETRQIYQYGIGVMASGDMMFSFVFATSVFAINLSRQSALEYILGFNNGNSFNLTSRWQLFPNR